MTEYEFLLSDRIQKIKQINKEYNLEKNAYVSFSGGKDSTVLHYLIDKAIPDNKIPRVYVNTGIEYNLVINFVREMQKTDPRIIEISPTKNIKEMLETDGYPFKSKEHSKKLHLLEIGSKAPSVLQYWRLDGQDKQKFAVPKILEYQRNLTLPFKVSDFCCMRLKKQPLAKWGKANKRHIAIIGIRREEGGQRQNIKNCLYFKNEKLNHFSPLLPVTENFINEFVEKENIKLCDLYSGPYNFTRTGCKGCPFALNLQNELDTLEKFFPNEKKQCEIIFKKVYEEYRKLNYRLKK